MAKKSILDELKIYHITGRWFLLIYFIIMLLFTFLFTSSMAINNLWTFIFAFSNTVTYPALYLAPAAAITLTTIYLLSLTGIKNRIISKIVFIEASLLTGLTILLLLVDYKIFSMFKFHINGFVLNLICTPGGIDSMGASETDYILSGILSVSCFAATGITFHSVSRLSERFPIPYRIELAAAILVTTTIAASTVIDKFQYAYDRYKNHTASFYNAQKIPLYITTRMKGFFKSIHIAGGKRDNIVLKKHKSALRYPLKPVEMVPPKKLYNLVFLVAESWRADTLTPEIMPATSRFASKAVIFHNHYSSGNGTRMALFGMFYGLYGSYWDAFLADRHPPVLIDVMKKLGYQFSMHTSAKFTYPEFDKTIFSGIDSKDMEQSAGRGGFLNDRKNVGDILDFIAARDKSKPFMTFMFFESPHAPYTFPDDCIIRKNYLPTFNYSTVNIEKNIGLIKNRYLNSVHHLDTQLSRIFEFLEQEKLLNNTIVVVAGDHGEEFMEKGHWGHNESFHQEQIRPPLMIYIPGKKHKDIYSMSSHLDVPAMLAPYFGINNPPKDFCLGYNLLDGTKRNYTVCASWNKICYIDDRYKYVLSPLPFPEITGLDDQELSLRDKENFDKTAILELMKNTRLFYAK